MSKRTKYMVMCDFDGTITTIDTADYILDKYAKSDWRELDQRLDRGEITLEECMVGQFAMVNVDESTILKELDKVVKIRPGLPELIGLCAKKEVEFCVVSAGLSFAIRHFIGKMGLGDKVKTYTGIARYNGDWIDFTFPPLFSRESKSFKDDFVRRKKLAGLKVVYIGDGVSDADAAILADIRYAVSEKRLATRLENNGLKYQGFSNFKEIVKGLTSML